MSPYEYLKNLHEVCMFQTREGAKFGLASNGELRRWIQNGVLTINHEKVKLDDVLDFPIMSIYLFTKAKRITIL